MYSNTEVLPLSSLPWHVYLIHGISLGFVLLPKFLVISRASGLGLNHISMVCHTMQQRPRKKNKYHLLHFIEPHIKIHEIISPPMLVKGKFWSIWTEVSTCRETSTLMIYIKSNGYQFIITETRSDENPAWQPGRVPQLRSLERGCKQIQHGIWLAVAPVANHVGKLKSHDWCNEQSEY